MSKEEGLKNKYEVSRVDGKPIEHGCIVLEWDDPSARKAIKTFALSVQEQGYKKLAADLFHRLDMYSRGAIELGPTDSGGEND